MPLRKIGHTWYIDLYKDGRRIRKKASTSKALAQKIHDKLAGERDLSRYGIAPDNYPLKDLASRFLLELQPRVSPKTLHDYQTILKATLEHLNLKPLNLNSLRHALNEYINLRASQGRSAKILNRTIGLFKRMLSYGVQTNLLSHNPLADIPFIKERRPPRQVLTPEEIKALLEHSGRYRLIWLTFLTTGLRRSELSRLTWKDLDLKACTLSVGASKTGAGVRVIPITPGLARELRALHKKDGEYVFTTGAGAPLKHNLLHRFKSCLKRAGIDPQGLNIHSLRHTFATLLASGNVHPKHIQALLGHKSALTSMDIYAKVMQKDLSEAVKKLDYGQAMV